MLAALLFLSVIKSTSQQTTVCQSTDYYCGRDNCYGTFIQDLRVLDPVVQACSAPAITDSTEVHSEWPANITRVKVERSGSFLDLFLEWSFQSDTSRVFEVSIRELKSQESDPLVCKRYKLPQAKSLGVFFDQCLTRVNLKGEYVINTSSKPSQVLQSHLLFIPDKLDLEEWRTPLLITYSAQTIRVVFNPIPRAQSDRYRLELSIIRKDGYVLQQPSSFHWLRESESSVIFNNTSAEQYAIKVVDCGHRIQSECTSPNYLLSYSFEVKINRTSSSMSGTPQDPDIKVSNVGGGQLRDEDIYVLVGTVVGGVTLGALIIGILVFIYIRKRRQQQRHGLRMRQFVNQNVYSDGLIALEDMKGSPPSILLVYSYDSQAHMACIQAFALILQNVFCCTVMADFWATQEVTERGINAWLQHKLTTVNYIIVICSTGARFKSATSRKALLEQESGDAYIAAMNMLQMNSSLYDNKRLAVYFDYACESDIPAQLESWPKFKLPHDMESLTPIFDCSEKYESTFLFNSHDKLIVDTLELRIGECKQYMSENPGWLHHNLHPPNEIVAHNQEPEDIVIVEPRLQKHDSDGEQQVDTVPNNGSTNPETETRKPDPFMTANEWRKNHGQNEKRESVLTPMNSSIALDQPSRSSQESRHNRTIRSLDSLSSVEDLEEDVEFILNPQARTDHRTIGLLPQYPLACQSHHINDLTLFPGDNMWDSCCIPDALTHSKGVNGGILRIDSDDHDMPVIHKSMAKRVHGNGGPLHLDNRGENM